MAYKYYRLTTTPQGGGERANEGSEREKTKTEKQTDEKRVGVSPPTETKTSFKLHVHVNRPELFRPK